MALSEAVQNRLYNWKFAQAAEALKMESLTATKQESDLVKALAIFGNPGWFQGGPMEVVIQAALTTILEFES